MAQQTENAETETGSAQSTVTKDETRDPSVSASKQNAAEKASSVLSATPYSYEGLIKYLENVGFTHDDAVYGADSVNADYNEQAYKKAQQILKYSAYSRSGLKKVLISAGFTDGQAEYGLDKVGLDDEAPATTETEKETVKETVKETEKETQAETKAKKKKAKKNNDKAELEKAETVQEMIDVLDKLGYTASFYDCTYEEDDGYISDAHSVDVFYDESRYPKEDLEDYYMIGSIENVDTSKKTVDVYYYGDLESLFDQQKEDYEAMREELDKKLDVYTAWTAFELYGKAEYPYGFSRKMFSVIAEEPKDEDTWFLKCTVKITNMFNATFETSAEAYVTGTTDNPKVTYFYVY